MCGTDLKVIFTAHVQVSGLVLSVWIINIKTRLDHITHTLPTLTRSSKKYAVQWFSRSRWTAVSLFSPSCAEIPCFIVCFITSLICLLLFYLPLVRSHVLTSGSECLGNSEVVRYLYRILMSSCSSPLLQTQPQIRPYNLHNTPSQNAKPKRAQYFQRHLCYASWAGGNSYSAVVIKCATMNTPEQSTKAHNAAT